MRSETLRVAGTTGGLTYEVPVLRFGSSDAQGRKAYIQAGLHADEAPGMIAAHELRRQLTALDAAGAVRGEIVLVPMANPIGLGQIVLGHHAGRFDLADGVNFNRDHSWLTDTVATEVESQLTDDPGQNRTIMRKALQAAAEAVEAVTPAQHLKRILLGLAIDADIVLDLHCDGEAVVHLYALPQHAEPLMPLAALLGARALLVSEESGGFPFDEAISRPWAELARRFANRAVGGAIAATVELRGRTDTTRATASADAAAIVAYLTLQGFIDGPMPDVPPPSCKPTPLEGSEALKAPVAGIVTFEADVGSEVKAGDIVAWIIDPATGAETAVTATTSGVLFARSQRRMAETGMRLGKIAGAQPFRSGKLLSP